MHRCAKNLGRIRARSSLYHRRCSQRGVSGSLDMMASRAPMRSNTKSTKSRTSIEIHCTNFVARQDSARHNDAIPWLRCRPDRLHDTSGSHMTRAHHVADGRERDRHNAGVGPSRTHLVIHVVRPFATSKGWETGSDDLSRPTMWAIPPPTKAAHKVLTRRVFRPYHPVLGVDPGSLANDVASLRPFLPRRRRGSRGAALRFGPSCAIPSRS